MRASWSSSVAARKTMSCATPFRTVCDIGPPPRAGGLELPRPRRAIVPHRAKLCRRKCDIPDPATILGVPGCFGPRDTPQAAQKGPDARRRPKAAGEAYSLYVEPAVEGANEADGPFSAACEGSLIGLDVVAVAAGAELHAGVEGFDG